MVYTRKETTKDKLDFWKRFKISELGIRIVLLAVIVTGGMSYLVMTSSTATKGLAVKDLSDRLDSLTTSSATLQAQVDRLQSMARLETAEQDLDLVQVSTLDYLTSSSSAVAAR
jgi:hypothetical protein